MINFKSLKHYCNLVDNKVFMLVQLFFYKAVGKVLKTNYHRFRFVLPVRIKGGKRLYYLFELFKQRNPEFKEFYRIVCIPGYSCLLDLGANIGTVSHYFLTSPGLSVPKTAILVEPQKKCCSYLRKIFSTANIRIVPSGASDRPESVVLHKKIELDGNASTTVMPHKHFSRFSKKVKKHESVHFAPIDNLYMKDKIDLIKINIEGGEPEAITGMKKLIKRDLPDILFDPHTETNLVSIKLLLPNYTFRKIDAINYLGVPIIV